MNLDNVQIIRSEKRKKTVSARKIGDKLFIYLPANLSKSEEEKWINNMKSRFEKSERRSDLNSDLKLQKRALLINRKYFDNILDFDIRYVTNQTNKFGSCTPVDKTVRISDRIADMPVWVRDYVIIHELAHLIFPNHSKDFWKKVNSYRYAERAKGFLIAFGMMSDDKK